MVLLKLADELQVRGNSTTYCCNGARPEVGEQCKHRNQQDADALQLAAAFVLILIQRAFLAEPLSLPVQSFTYIGFLVHSLSLYFFGVYFLRGAA